MIKFKESELTENLQHFKDTDIVIEFEQSLVGDIQIQNATIKYNKYDGFIYINSNVCKLKINTTLVNSYEKDDNYVYIKLDALNIKIK